MSVAAIQPPNTIYREEQLFPAWVYALLLGAVALDVALLVWWYQGGLPDQRGRAAFGFLLTAGLFVPAVLAVGVLRLTTVVLPGCCRIWFGFVPTVRRDIDLAAVQSIAVVRYRPLAEHGGWGLRVGRGGERAFTARGDQGVRITFLDGSRVLIGSQRPEELARALEQARPVAR